MAAVADVFDALTSDRPYRQAFPIEQAVEIMRGERGRHFDPRLVDLFIENIDELAELRIRYTPSAEPATAATPAGQLDQVQAPRQVATDANTARWRCRRP